MKRTLRLPSGRAGLLLGFVIAFSLHGLALSYLQLKRSRERPPQTLTSRDNTPELLQFGSQAYAPTSLSVLPLPKASVLPPPPSNPLPHRQPPLAGGKTVKMKASSQPKVKQRRAQTQGRLKLVQRMSPASERSGEWQLLAVQHLRRFQRQEQETAVAVGSESLQAASDQENVADPVLQVPASPPPEAYQALWNRSQPQSPVTWQQILTAHPGPAIEVRHLPIAQSKNIAAPVEHRQIVAMGSQIILFWIDGSRLWMLQSARRQASPS
ncbi:MAG: hypothetical protein ACK40D_10975 [Cyanobacteriota bacterium]|jgi:hypothetical protein